MRNSKVKSIALCGILAAAAIVIMFLGGLIPLSTYMCPVLCTIICNIVLVTCGMRMALIWYIAVSALALMLGPDREAVIFYTFIGSYPCVKRYLDKFPFRKLWKMIYLNLISVGSLMVCAYILGLGDIFQELSVMGGTGALILLLLSNFTFYLLDILLDRLNNLSMNKRR